MLAASLKRSPMYEPSSHQQADAMDESSGVPHVFKRKRRPGAEPVEKNKLRQQANYACKGPRMDLQENLVSDRALDRVETSAVSTSRFTTETANDILPLANGAWLCINGILVVSLFCVFLLYEAAIWMKTMWYLSYLFFLVFPPLGLAVNTLWTKLRCQLKDGCCAVIHIHGEGRDSYLLEAVSATLRQVIQSGNADLVIEREEKTVGNWSWQANLIPSTNTCSLRVTGAGMGENKVVK